MLLLKIYFIHDSEEKADDVVEFRTSSRDNDSTIEVKHTPGETKTTYKSWLSRNGAIRYVRNLIAGLSRDVDPCDKIQIMSSMAPCVLYSVKDLQADVYLRETIEESVEDLFNHRVAFVPAPVEEDEDPVEDEYADMPALVPAYTYYQ
jgi:hypothetical protein